MKASTTIAPRDTVITSELSSRPTRSRGLRAQVAALAELPKLLAASPRAALRRCAELALRLCRAGSAGVTRIEVDAACGPAFRWFVVAGAMASHEGLETPREASICTLALHTSATILLSRPARAYRYLRCVAPATTEILVAPLSDCEGEPLGTMWVAHHELSARFTANDMSVLELLASHATLALQLMVEREARPRAIDVRYRTDTAERMRYVGGPSARKICDPRLDE